MNSAVARSSTFQREATPARFHARNPGRYRKLHFATHARVIERPAERSCLRLHGGNLDLAAVRALRLRAEVVTLSACETALGRRMRGEGVVGLTHAFLSAGARGVVASLWKVEDRATAEFMEAWYRRLGAGVPPARALHETRIAYFAAGAHPSVWAGFVLVGGIERYPPAIAPTTR
jgi:CHAT domain-containing protein